MDFLASFSSEQWEVFCLFVCFELVQWNFLMCPIHYSYCLYQCTVYLIFGEWEPPHVGYIRSLLYLVFIAFLLSGRQDVPGSFCRFLIPDRGFSRFSKEYWYFSGKYSAIIIWMLKVLIATELVTVFRPIQPRELGNVYSLKQKKKKNHEFIPIHFFFLF